MSVGFLLNLIKFSFAYLFFSPLIVLTYKMFAKGWYKKHLWVYTLVLAGYIFLISLFIYNRQMGVY